MKRHATRSAYANRIDRVLRHIGADLDHRHSLEDLARIACLSQFHFHRVFRVLTGETPDEAVRRMRLHRAAIELINSSVTVERIARRAGYGSVVAFTRAFSASYGLAPVAYRLSRGKHPIGHATHHKENAMYDIKIGHSPGYRLLGLSHAGDYHQIARAFERVGAYAGAHGLVGPVTDFIGIYFDDPQTVPTAQLRSFAGISVDETVDGEGEFQIMQIPSGPVATLLFKGPYPELEQVYQHLYREWLPASGREPADHPCFERYLNSPQEVLPTELLTEILMPLKAA
jgi:AraC family transcriptional regulator